MLSAMLVADLSSEVLLNIASSSSAGMSLFPSATQVSYRFFNIELNLELRYCSIDTYYATPKKSRKKFNRAIKSQTYIRLVSYYHILGRWFIFRRLNNVSYLKNQEKCLIEPPTHRLTSD